MEKIFDKVLEIIDYSQEAKDNADIVLFIASRLEAIVSLSKEIKDAELQAGITKYVDTVLGSICEDMLGVELEEDIKAKLIEKLKNRG